MSQSAHIINCRTIADVEQQLQRLAREHPDPSDRKVSALLVVILPPILRALNDRSIDGTHAVALVSSLVGSIVGSVAGLHLPPYVRAGFAAAVFETARHDCLLSLRLHAAPPANDTARPS